MQKQGEPNWLGAPAPVARTSTATASAAASAEALLLSSATEACTSRWLLSVAGRRLEELVRVLEDPPPDPVDHARPLAFPQATGVVQQGRLRGESRRCVATYCWAQSAAIVRHLCSLHVVHL